MGPASCSEPPPREHTLAHTAKQETIVRRFLQRKGYEVEVSDCAEHAIERLRAQETFDVILSDCKIPGIGGEGLYRWIEENRPNLRSILIFSSGDVASPGTHRFLEGTGCPVLPKPYELTDLEAMLAEVIRRGKGTT